MVFSGSDPSARPWTNSRPVISFCRDALTVPYVLEAMLLDIEGSELSIELQMSGFGRPQRHFRNRIRGIPSEATLVG